MMRHEHLKPKWKGAPPPVHAYYRVRRIYRDVPKPEGLEADKAKLDASLRAVYQRSLRPGAAR